MWQVGTFIGEFLLNKTFEMVQQLKHYNTQQRDGGMDWGHFFAPQRLQVLVVVHRVLSLKNYFGRNETKQKHKYKKKLKVKQKASKPTTHKKLCKL
jgi:hypothetical protein